MNIRTQDSPKSSADTVWIILVKWSKLYEIELAVK